jgi:uncharacterized protein
VGDVPLAPVELLIFQGTPFCNIDCVYCYLADRRNNSRISLDIVERACDRLVEADLIIDDPVVLWHSGEPLVLPASFYDKAFSVIESRLLGRRVEHKIQTNATLINDEWINLFRKWKVTVGISIDGPPSIHDGNRRTRGGGPTSAKVLASAKQIKEAGLRLQVICVLTRESIAIPGEIFDFFEGLGVDAIGFNIDEAEGVYLQSSHCREDASTAFYGFFREYFGRVASTNSKQSVRELHRGLSNIFKTDHRRSYENFPIQVLTVGHNGEVGTFSPELFRVEHAQFGRMTFGNVLDSNVFHNMRGDKRLHKIVDSINRGIAICQRNCGYFDVCKGGVPSNKLGEFGTFEVGQTIACQFRQQAATNAVVDLILSGVRPPMQGERIL